MNMSIKGARSALCSSLRSANLSDGIATRQDGLTAKLHILDVDASERWTRVNARNKSQGETFHMEITRGMFDYIETTWLPPNDDEIEAISEMDIGQ